jgi:hypothetical protein
LGELLVESWKRLKKGHSQLWEPREKEEGKPWKARSSRKAITCVNWLSPTCKQKGNKHERRATVSMAVE